MNDKHGSTDSHSPGALAIQALLKNNRAKPTRLSKGLSRGYELVQKLIGEQTVVVNATALIQQVLDNYRPARGKMTNSQEGYVIALKRSLLVLGGTEKQAGLIANNPENSEATFGVMEIVTVLKARQDRAENRHKEEADRLTSCRTREEQKTSLRLAEEYTGQTVEWNNAINIVESALRVDHELVVALNRHLAQIRESQPTGNLRKGGEQAMGSAITIVEGAMASLA